MTSMKTDKGPGAEPLKEPMADPAMDALIDPAADAELAQALANFRGNVHAWSEAEFNRPRTARIAARAGWRPVLAWTLGCMVVACGVSGGIYDYHRVVVERQAAAARIEHQRKLAEEQRQQAAMNPAANDENLLANVDSDVSRSVPAAMEPLAQLMQEDGTN